MFLAFKEKLFAKRVIRRLLESYAAVNAENPGMSGKTLYREVLMHTRDIDPALVDQVLHQAENSIDQWTAGGRDALGFREVAHFFVLSQYQARGHKGTVISLGQIVNSMVKRNL